MKGKGKVNQKGKGKEVVKKVQKGKEKVEKKVKKGKEKVEKDREEIIRYDKVERRVWSKFIGETFADSEEAAKKEILKVNSGVRAFK